MADFEGTTQVPETERDIEMEVEEIEGDEGALPGDGDETAVAAPNPQTLFLDYLRSPVVNFVVGKNAEQTTISAHQAILERSAYFKDRLESLALDKLILKFPEESPDAFGCFLQYQYTGEYFPRRLPSAADGLEQDASLPRSTTMANSS
jgi:hypothetical protein